MSAGTRKSICVLLTKLTGADSPFTVTPTPLTVVGSVLPVTCQVPVTAESPLPLISIHVLGATGPERKVAALTTPAVWNDGTACTLPNRPWDSTGSLFGPP